MTDKELLELAAKAAGIDYNAQDGLRSYPQNKKLLMYWNPLTDDGDALRLAVKLNFEIYIGRTYVHVEDWNGRTTKIGSDEISDIYAATRRAIVRAAAEIGKTL